jgi:hypothetical protein
VYGRELDGGVLTLEASGWTYEDVFVLHDQETGSLWYPYPDVPGLRAIAGPLEGRTLPLVEGERTTWSEWVDAHPDTVLLQTP